MSAGKGRARQAALLRPAHERRREHGLRRPATSRSAGLTDAPAASRSAPTERVQDRSCPTLWNVGYQQAFFWEGSAPTLEAAVARRLAIRPGARRQGTARRGRRRRAPQRRARLSEPVRRRLRPGGDRRKRAEGPRRLSAHARGQRLRLGPIPGRRSAGVERSRAPRGWALFDGKAKCTGCHNGLLLTDLQFHNVGIGTGGKDPGRFDITKEPRHRGAFKTPTLLNVSRSAPYFHDGSVATLAEAVDLMAGGGVPNPNPRRRAPARRADRRGTRRPARVPRGADRGHSNRAPAPPK